MNKMISMLLLVCLGLTGCQSMEHRSGLPAKEPLDKLANALSIKPVWSKSVNRGVDKTDANLTVAEKNGRLYSVDAKGQLTVLELQTGKIVRQIQLNRTISAGIVLGDKQAFMADSNSQVLAVNLETGKVNWEKNVHAEVLALPTYSDGVLYVHGMNGSLQAINSNTGKSIYQYASSAPSLILRRAAEPVVTERYVLNGFANGKLAAINRHEGTSAWERVVGIPSGFSDLERMSDIGAAPLVVNQTVYVVSYRGSLMSMTLSGELNWEKPFSSFSGLMLDNQVLYISDAEGVLWAIQGSTGNTLWKQEMLKGRFLTKPVFQSGYVVVADEDGLVHWFEAKTGLAKGRYQFDKKGVRATPRVKNHTLYILSQGGKMTALTINKS